MPAMTGVGEEIPRERPATRDDAPAIARLVDIAAHGMAKHIWATMAEPGNDPLAVGTELARLETEDFSFRNATILEIDDVVVGCIVGYPLPEEPEDIDLTELPSLVVPLVQLEARACSSWYIYVVAVEPAWRGQGLGQRLLRCADRFAKRASCEGTSLIVADANRGARRLYARAGYAEMTSLPMIKNGWQSEGERWILCRKLR